MSDIRKYLMDDHRRLRRAFNIYRQDPTSISAALHACDQVWIHARLEEEMLYPVLAEADVEALQEEHEVIADLMAEVDQFETYDPELPKVMERVARAVDFHIRDEERSVFPRLAAGDERMAELGRQAFRRRQELMTERPPRGVRLRLAAETGWGNKVANAGW